MGDGYMDQLMYARPPETFERIVRLLVPPASREHVMGDLYERYSSRRQYLVDVLCTLPFVFASRIRRTSNIPLLVLTALFLRFAVFQGAPRNNGLIALIPAAVAMLVLVLRDVYRTLTPNWPRQAAIDVLLYAGAVLLSEAVLALSEPQLLLSRQQLLLVFPISCGQLFYLRLMVPTGYVWPAPTVRAISMNELLREARGLERNWRLVLRIEIGLGLSLGAGLAAISWSAPGSVERIGLALMAAGAFLLVWLLTKYARVRPLPPGLGFAESVAIYRTSLQHRAKLASRYLRLYVLPMIPGCAVLLIDGALRSPNLLVHLARVATASVVLVVLFVQVQNSSAAKFRRRTEQLDLVTEAP
jgi:hypothetical protein